MLVVYKTSFGVHVASPLKFVKAGIRTRSLITLTYDLRPPKIQLVGDKSLTDKVLRSALINILSVHPQPVAIPAG